MLFVNLVSGENTKEPNIRRKIIFLLPLTINSNFPLYSEFPIQSKTFNLSIIRLSVWMLYGNILHVVSARCVFSVMDW